MAPPNNVAALLPPVPTKKQAEKLFNDHPGSLRYNDLVLASYWYTNKELSDRDNAMRRAQNLGSRPKRSNIITKWLTEALQDGAERCGMLPSIFRRIYDINRYRILKDKPGVDIQSLRSLQILTLSDKHAPHLVDLPDHPKFSDVKPFLGKTWGRPPDAVWAALLPIVGEHGRDMKMLKWLCRQTGRTTPESAYGFVAEIRRLGPHVQWCLDNRQAESQLLFDYQAAEVEKIAAEGFDPSNSPQGAERSTTTSTAKPCETRRSRTAAQQTPGVSDASSATDADGDVEMPDDEDGDAEMTDDDGGDVEMKDDDDDGREIFVRARSASAPSQASTPASVPPPVLLLTNAASIDPRTERDFEITRDSPTGCLEESLRGWASNLGLHFESSPFRGNKTDEKAFATYLDKNEPPMANVHGPRFLVSYMLACLVEWALQRPTDRLRSLQHLLVAAEIFCVHAHEHVDDFAPLHDLDGQTGQAQGYYLVLYGLHIKAIIDPPGANRVQLTAIAHRCGNDIERDALDWFLRSSDRMGNLPRIVDPSTERDIRARALDKWLASPFPRRGLMAYFWDSIPETFALAPADTDLALSQSRHLAHSTAKLARGLRILAHGDVASLRGGRGHDLAAALADECEAMDPRYLWVYFGFFCEEFSDGSHAASIRAVEATTSWSDAGVRAMRVIQHWLRNWPAPPPPRRRNILHHIVSALVRGADDPHPV